MRKLLVLLAVTSLVNAASIEEANDLYSQRANSTEGVAKARQAAEMYKSLSDATSSTSEKSELKIKESAAIYFVGNRVSGKKEILATFKRGYEAADFAVNNTAGSEKSTALYWYAANIGRWGEAKGVLASLSKWSSSMKPALKEAIALDKKIEFYGPLRVMGKAYLKVPGESDKKGYAMLKEAYNSTLMTIEVDGEEIELSGQVNNVVFFLWAMKKKNKDTDTFCEVYDNAEMLYDGGKEVWETYNPTAVPSTEKELTDFFSGKGDFKGVTKYYDENC